MITLIRAAAPSMPRVPREPKQINRFNTYFWRPSPIYGLLVLVCSTFWFSIWFLPQVLSGSLVPQTGLGVFGIIVFGMPGLIGLATGAIAVLGPMLYRRVLGLSDSSFDEQLSLDGSWLAYRGLMKLGLEAPGSGAIPDLIIQGSPISVRLGISRRAKEWDWQLRETQVRWAYGDDGEVRFGIYSYAAFYQATHHIGHYTCHYEVASGVILWERTADVHNKDIVALVSEEQTLRDIQYPLWLQRVFDLFSVFSISVFFSRLVQWIFTIAKRPDDFILRSVTLLLSSGGSLEVPVSIFHGDRQFTAAQRSGATIGEDAVARMRALLRENRQNYVRMV